MRNLSRPVYRLARFLNDVHAVLNPSRLPRRIANKVLGRLMGRLFLKGRKP